MLPEALSNGWCSLRPSEDRGCLFVETAHRRARPQDRAPLRPRPDAQRGAPHLRAGAGGARRRRDLGLPPAHLYAAFRALLAARTARGTLDLDLPERRVVLDDDGRVAPGRAAPAPRQPPADRGIHGAGQCRGRRGTGAAAPARACTASTRRRRRRSSQSLRDFLHGLGISLPRRRPGASARSRPRAAPSRRHARRRRWSTR